MSTCKDCIHTDVCRRPFNTAKTQVEFAQVCHDFKNKADFVAVKHGEWVHTDNADHWFSKDECSKCQYHTFDRVDLTHLNYCPNCGADMRKEGADNV